MLGVNITCQNVATAKQGVSGAWDTGLAMLYEK